MPRPWASAFPNYKRVEYMSGAVARKGTDFALIANTRIQVGNKGGNGYGFREFLFEETPRKDPIRIVDNCPGFEVDARKVSLKSPSACPPTGFPAAVTIAALAAAAAPHPGSKPANPWGSSARSVIVG